MSSALNRKPDGSLHNAPSVAKTKNKNNCHTRPFLKYSNPKNSPAKTKDTENVSGIMILEWPNHMEHIKIIEAVKLNSSEIYPSTIL